MQWLLQDFEDTRRLAEALDRLQISYTWHKVVPFVGALAPEPDIAEPQSVILFGSYALWRTAKERGYRPGVLKLRPFVHEHAWHPHLLNGADALFLRLRDVPGCLPDDGRDWFLRPVDDSKEEPGNVQSSGEIIRMARAVLALEEEEIPPGSLRHDTLLMLTEPVRILREWRLWAVGGRIVTYSLYKDGARVVHRREIDDDALAFAQQMVDINPGYSPAFVIDICRTELGLKLLETNCINAAGFYAADLDTLAAALEELG
ncbi:ATP-grasp domain-containing protein [Ensifer sp. MJa1]|uniref:ATP-grasp domain-containing protein n=1 Tax=Ensifer sp. MJa1 TaxID=2919888 RepID=UPI00300BBC36